MAKKMAHLAKYLQHKCGRLEFDCQNPRQANRGVASIVWNLIVYTAGE